MTSIWEAAERRLGRRLPRAPFWAFAWPAGSVLARWVLDHPELVRGRWVVDVGAGSGIVGIAAAIAAGGRPPRDREREDGPPESRVVCLDEDPLAAPVIRTNAAANGVRVTAVTGGLRALDPTQTQSGAGDLVVLAADVCYERRAGRTLLNTLSELARHGVLVVLADGGRGLLPATLGETWAVVRVWTDEELEGTEWRDVRIVRWS